jgi:sulfite exporter TauE/SafE
MEIMNLQIPLWVIITLISVGSSAAYIVLGGITAGITATRLSEYSEARAVLPWFAGILWPLALPVAVGHRIAYIFIERAEAAEERKLARKQDVNKPKEKACKCGYC